MIDLATLRMIPRYPVGWARCNYVDGLIDFAKEHITQDTEVVELGTFDGVSTAVFATFAGRVITLDIETRLAPILDSFSNVGRIQADSIEFGNKQIDNSLDLVYLDTQHDYSWVVTEINTWLPKVKIGGILSGHDFHPNSLGVIQAVVEAFGFPDRVYSDTTWMIRRS